MWWSLYWSTQPATCFMLFLRKLWSVLAKSPAVSHPDFLVARGTHLWGGWQERRDFLIHDGKTKHFFYLLLRVMRVTWLSLFSHQPAQARQKSVYNWIIIIGLYNMYLALLCWFFLCYMGELYTCIYVGFPNLGSTDDPHRAQQTPKAECFFLRKASLAFIQLLKTLTTLLHNKGICISM